MSSQINQLDSIKIIINKKNIVLGKSTQIYSDVNTDFNYLFGKPKMWDIIGYIRDYTYKLDVFTIQKENLKLDVMALINTVAIIPFDQIIVDNPMLLGHKLKGWDQNLFIKERLT
jgi:hypothetical protein